ncbi:hypothetical protein BCS65_08750 [Vibrio cyclitrophicus]|uniref:hypothetical protein n=1 Tax=Vibrio cyclitrophicus TaxID=47951 RepID=UPI0018E46F3F|nr:hypothetical protein [Vibrio cyclitrophicus]
MMQQGHLTQNSETWINHRSLNTDLTDNGRAIQEGLLPFPAQIHQQYLSVLEPENNKR